MQSVHQAGVADQHLRPRVADHVRQQVATERGVDRAVPGAQIVGRKPDQHHGLAVGQPNTHRITLLDPELAQGLGGCQHLGPGLRPGPLLAVLEHCKNSLRRGCRPMVEQWAKHRPFPRWHSRVEPRGIEISFDVHGGFLMVREGAARWRPVGILSRIMVHSVAGQVAPASHNASRSGLANFESPNT